MTSDDTDTHPVTLHFECSLSKAGWEVVGLRLSERFNEPYKLGLELRSDDPDADATAMLGASIVVTLDRAGLHRELCGIVECVGDGVYEQGHTLADLTVVPALMTLAQRRTSRIFSDMSIPEILAEVLEAGLGPYQRSVDTSCVSGDYPVQEYTVQYRESDLDFVHRMLEEHGIGYRFDHADGVETLVLFDGPEAYAELTSYANEAGTLPMILTGGSSGTREDVRAFQRQSQLRSTVARSTVFNWLAPDETIDFEDDESADLSNPNGAELGPEREDYDHEEPGTLSGYRSEGLDLDAVARQVALRRKLHQRDALRFVGTTTAMQLRPGARFELLDHPSADFNRKYLVVAVEHSAGDRINPDHPDEAYTNRIECLPIEVEWRPERKTRRPRMPSMQTARVVGPPGEEIYTDEHGRIKVQFHWDRRKHDDEGASCFIRVVQAWAGNGWGSTFLPRIGMEVAVTFIDGDPDRPVVTGCLYNGQNTPPYALPDDKTKSTIKTQSSPGGGGFNELRFEDAAGSEEIYIHAQRDFNEVVLHNHNTTVGNNQTNKVAVDQTQIVRGDQKENVAGHQSVSVGGNRTVKVTGNFEETLEGTETRMVTGDVTEVFMSCENRAVAGDQDEVIGGDERHAVTGNRDETIMGSLSQSITGGVKVKTPGTYNLQADGGVTMTAKGGMTMIAEAGFTILAPGGTKTVDKDFWKFGGESGDVFKWKVDAFNFKLEMALMSFAFSASKVELIAIEVAQSWTTIRLGGSKFETLVDDTSSSWVSWSFSALKSIS